MIIINKQTNVYRDIHHIVFCSNIHTYVYTHIYTYTYIYKHICIVCILNIH